MRPELGQIGAYPSTPVEAVERGWLVSGRDGAFIDGERCPVTRRLSTQDTCVAAIDTPWMASHGAELLPAARPCGTGRLSGSAHSSPAEAFLGFVLGQGGNWLSGGVLLLGVEGSRPDACGPAAL